jgi:hypothetical protein
MKIHKMIIIIIIIMIIQYNTSCEKKIEVDFIIVGRRRRKKGDVRRTDRKARAVPKNNVGPKF